MPARVLLLLIASLAANPLSAGSDVLRLATTSSAAASGLIDLLLPPFERASGIDVVVSVAGSGAALRQGREGDADLVLVHSPTAEARFIAGGHGVERIPLVRNDFLIIGPAADPAGLAGSRDIVIALRRIHQHRAPFLSRADDSGTHRKELELWQAASVAPYGQPWYHEMGMTIAELLERASIQQAYTLTDRGSWLAFKERLRLVSLSEGDPRLRNVYSVIAVNPARHPGVNAAGANALIAWLRSQAARALIAGHRISGEPAFRLDGVAQ